MRLKVDAVGVIDCFRDGCNYQGMEYCMYDFTQPAVRSLWVTKILAAMIDSPHIDGTFLDECDNLVNNLCKTWDCTPAEVASFTNGTLALLDEALLAASALGKWLVISLTSTLTNNPSYHAAVMQSILTHRSGFRFYEFFKTEDQLRTFVYEAQTLGIPVQVHADTVTRSPDFVELAMFLIGAGPYSYFSYSVSWNFDSFPWQPEYDWPLGAPLGPASNTNVTVSLPPWSPLNGTNLICSMPSHPGASGPNLAYLGTAPSAAACGGLAAGNASYTAWTWVGPEVAGGWALGCYARTDPGVAKCVPAAGAGACTAPCYASQEVGVTSAVGVEISYVQSTWTREFEHLSVSVVPATFTASLTRR